MFDYQLFYLSTSSPEALYINYIPVHFFSAIQRSHPDLQGQAQNILLPEANKMAIELYFTSHEGMPFLTTPEAAG